ncbi:MAG: PmoA family protein [Planctomycetota bacterium]
MSIDENDQAISIRRSSRLVVAYNKVSPPVPQGIDPIYHRSGFLHPLKTPDGRTVTDMFPKDHPHQHGIFTAWVKTTYGGRKVDFWNLARGTGRVLHKKVIRKKTEDDAVGFDVELIHRTATEPRVDILREQWSISVLDTNGTYNCIDLRLVQTALTDTPLIIEQNRYGGFAVRGRSEWLSPEDRDQQQVAGREPSRMLNDRGEGRLTGNHGQTRWAVLTGELEGKPATIAVLSHATNFRAPQAVRMHPTKPYFCFSPCVGEAFQIDRDHPYAARYRILVTDAAPDPAWIDAEWTKWGSDSEG